MMMLRQRVSLPFKLIFFVLWMAGAVAGSLVQSFAGSEQNWALSTACRQELADMS